MRKSGPKPIGPGILNSKKSTAIAQLVQHWFTGSDSPYSSRRVPCADSARGRVHCRTSNHGQFKPLGVRLWGTVNFQH